MLPDGLLCRRFCLRPSFCWHASMEHAVGILKEKNLAIDRTQSQLGGAAAIREGSYNQ